MGLGKIITKEERTYKYLKQTVKGIYSVFKKTAKLVNKKYPNLTFDLPKDITFISTLELEKKYPTLTRKEREHAIAKETKAVLPGKTSLHFCRNSLLLVLATGMLLND